MQDDGRQPQAPLKGRLADVYIPALVAGALDALSHRLGNRATIDDPIYGRATTLPSLEPLVTQIARYFSEIRASYRHTYSTTGVDRDAAEGVLDVTVDGKTRLLPVVVMAERRKLREIELRVYYANDGHTPRKTRSPFVTENQTDPLPPLVAGIVDALRAGSVDQMLASFEETAKVVDSDGNTHEKRDGAMEKFFAELGKVEILTGPVADDGRACCLETTMTRGTRSFAGLFCFERGDSGLVRELRLYWD